LLRTGINGSEKRQTAFYPKMNIRVISLKKMAKEAVRDKDSA
jgi:hypothetical protein